MNQVPPASDPRRFVDPRLAAVDPRLNYRDYQRQRMLTLGDLLLENRIILLQGEIYDGNASEVVMKLLYLQSENRRKEIHFYINSPGGSVTATMAMYDTMQILSCPVATYCVGLAASGGAVLLAGGSKRQRFALSARQGDDPSAVRPGGRTSFRHRNSGRRNPENPRIAERNFVAAHRASRSNGSAKIPIATVT